MDDRGKLRGHSVDAVWIDEAQHIDVDAWNRAKKKGRIRRWIGDFFAAFLILGAVFYVPWVYYILTGDYMEFGR